MTFLGMGSLEIIVITLVAFIVMGPQRMIEAAKLIGKTTGELRRLSHGLTNVLEEPLEDTADNQYHTKADGYSSGNASPHDAISTETAIGHEPSTFKGPDEVIENDEPDKDS